MGQSVNSSTVGSKAVDREPEASGTGRFNLQERPMEGWLTLETAAGLLDQPLPEVLALVQVGDLLACRVGRHLLIGYQSLVDFALNNSSRAAASIDHTHGLVR